MSNESAVGERVLIRTAHNKIRKATIHPVPRQWRDHRERDNWTTKGKFPKAWVKDDESGAVCPWPLSDIFDDAQTASEVVARYDKDSYDNRREEPKWRKPLTTKSSRSRPTRS